MATPSDNSMQFNGSFQHHLNNTDVVQEDPKKCFIMGGKKFKEINKLKWPRSPSPKTLMSPRSNSDRESICN